MKKPEKVMEFWLISRPGEVMEIFKSVKVRMEKSWKMEIYLNKSNILAQHKMWYSQ